MPHTLPLNETPHIQWVIIRTRRREHSMAPSSTSLSPHSTLEGDCVAALTRRYLRAVKKKNRKKSVYDHTVTIRRSKRYFFEILPAWRGIRSKRFMVSRVSPMFSLNPPLTHCWRPALNDLRGKPDSFYTRLCVRARGRPAFSYF